MTALSSDRRSSIVRRGTTLLEVFMVLLILTGTLSIFGLSGAFHSRTSLRQDSDEVISALRLARETAVLSGCVVEVRHTRREHPSTGLSCDAIELIASPGPYRDLADKQNVGHFGRLSKNKNEWMADPIWLNGSTRIKTDFGEIKFDENGLASQDTTWVIQQSSDAVKVYIEAISGNILHGTY